MPTRPDGEPKFGKCPRVRRATGTWREMAVPLGLPSACGRSGDCGDRRSRALPQGPPWGQRGRGPVAGSLLPPRLSAPGCPRVSLGLGPDHTWCRWGRPEESSPSLELPRVDRARLTLLCQDGPGPRGWGHSGVPRAPRGGHGHISAVPLGFVAWAPVSL